MLLAKKAIRPECGEDSETVRSARSTTAAKAIVSSEKPITILKTRKIIVFFQSHVFGRENIVVP